MKKSLILLFALFSIALSAQNVIQRSITINEDYNIKIDVAPTSDSIPNGMFQAFYKNKRTLKGNYREGKKNGTWILYYPNGQQKLKARFSEGKKHGQWTLWSEQGDVQAKITFNNGEPIGNWQGYYSEHSKAIDIVFTPSGKPVQSIQYYGKEIIALNHEYEYDGDDVQANYAYYYENYNLFHYEQRTNNTLDGQILNYFENGLIWEKYLYENGKLIAISENRTESGVPLTNESFRSGTGTFTKYYKTGNTYSQTTYLNGKKNGAFTILDQGKSTSGTGTFINNKPTGVWDVYSKYHHVIESYDFDTLPGLVFVKIRLSPAKKEHEEGPKQNGYKHGTWRAFNPYGDLVSETNYQYGFLHGVAKEYEGEQLARQYHFEYGNKSGKFTHFNMYDAIQSEEEFVSETTFDTGWYNSPEPDWISVENTVKHTHPIHIQFYPSYPGMELLETSVSLSEHHELLFPVQRSHDYIYTPTLVPASFFGGHTEERMYISKNLPIPEIAKKQNMDGTVLIRYYVNELGVISDVTLLKSIGFGIDEAVIDFFKAYPPINSATFNGLPIPSYVVREIDIKI